jgi:hypothetical protein
MNKKHGLLFGFAVIAIAAIFTLTGCPTDGGGGGDGGKKTIALTKEGKNVLVFTLSQGEWVSYTNDPLGTVGDVAAGGLQSNQVNKAYEIQSDKRVLKVTVTKKDTDGTFTYSLKDSGSIGYLLVAMIADNFGSSDEEWTAASGKKGPVSITIVDDPGDNPGTGSGPEVPGTGGELWEKFTTAKTAATATAWKKDSGDITLTFYFYEKREDRGYANLYYTATGTTDINHDLYVKLNSATSWFLGRLENSKNIAFNGSDRAGTVTFASATSMTIAGIDAEEDESMYNGTYTKQQGSGPEVPGTGGTVDGLAYSATETRTMGGGMGTEKLYLLSGTYEAAHTSLTAQFDSATNSSMGGGSTTTTALATNAPIGAVLYVVSTYSNKTIRYLTKKASGSWSDTVEWEVRNN